MVLEISGQSAYGATRILKYVFGYSDASGWTPSLGKNAIIGIFGKAMQPGGTLYTPCDVPAGFASFCLLWRFFLFCHSSEWRKTPHTTPECVLCFEFLLLLLLLLLLSLFVLFFFPGVSFVPCRRVDVFFNSINSSHLYKLRSPFLVVASLTWRECFFPPTIDTSCGRFSISCRGE